MVHCLIVAIKGSLTTSFPAGSLGRQLLHQAGKLALKQTTTNQINRP
jgi:hypothetical protein